MQPTKSEPIKFLVLADKSGNVKAAAKLPMTGARTGAAPTETGIAIPGEDVYEVELPSELANIDKPLFDEYLLDIKGGRARLERKKKG